MGSKITTLKAKVLHPNFLRCQFLSSLTLFLHSTTIYTMSYTLQHRDIAGCHLSPGDHCLVTEHNRIILAKVVKLYPDSNFLQLKPLNSSAGGRRSKPNPKPIRRECYNVYRIADTEITMSILRGAI